MSAEEKEFNDWLKTAAMDSGKKIEGSVAMVSLFTKNYVENPLCAFQLGIAVMLDKPIVLIVDETERVPSHIMKIASVVQRVRKDNADDMKLAQEAIQQFLVKFERKKK